MKRQFLLISAVLISMSSLWTLTAFAEPLPMTPGKYEVVTASGLRNDPLGQPKKTTRCLRAGEMVNPDYVFNARVISAYKADESCKIGVMNIKDGNLVYTADCKVETVRVEGAVSANAYSVKRTVKSKSSGGVTLLSTLEGKRIGECS